MKQNLYKDMYDKIQLNNEQKNRIWNRLEMERGYGGTGKSFRTSVFAPVCVCIVLLIGVPALAANTSIVQKLADTFNLLNTTELNVTEEQKEMYEKYGRGLKNEIALDNGTLKLEAIISDEHSIRIPFSLKLKERKFNGILQTLSDLTFSFKDDNKSLGECTMLGKKQSKDTVITGCYLLDTGSERVIKQGDVLQITSRKKFEEIEEKTGKTEKEIRSLIPVLSEVTINTVAESRYVLVEASIQEDLIIDSIQLSPLALIIEGADYVSNTDSLDYSEIFLELKDGSTVKRASTGGGGSENVYDNTFYTYLMIVPFEAPVNPDDVAGIRINNSSFDLYIPADYLED